MADTFVETFWLATRSLTRNPGRTGLTILGLAIGVAAFIAMVSFGDGARRSVVDQFENLGVNVISVAQRGIRPGGRPPAPLSDADLDALERETVSLQFAVPVASWNTFLNYDGREHVTKLRATTPKFVELNGWGFVGGGMYDELDVERRNKTCVLGARPAEVLFGAKDPLGEVVTVHGMVRCRIVGVLEEKGRATSGRDLDDVVLMPTTTFFTYIRPYNRFYSSIDIRPIDGVSRGAARSEVVDALRHSHALPAGAEDDFIISSPDDAIKVAEDVSRILTRLLAGIAAVSLLVGGIGIMNIQLVAVAERTQEIGIRSAIGASPAQIMAQFITEAVLLALVGTLLGAAAGAGVAYGVARAMRWSSTVPVDAVLGAVAFGAAVGVLFGYLPAQRAARLDPIEALRRE